MDKLPNTKIPLRKAIAMGMKDADMKASKPMKDDISGRKRTTRTLPMMKKMAKGY